MCNVKKECGFVATMPIFQLCTYYNLGLSTIRKIVIVMKKCRIHQHKIRSNRLIDKTNRTELVHLMLLWEH